MITLREYEAGEFIFREGESAETAYVIEHGRVQVMKSLDGQDIHLAYLGAGEPFGEMSVIDDQPRSASVRAVETTLVREIRRDHFLRLLQTEPEVGINLLKVLFERLREASTMIIQLHKEKAQPVRPVVGLVAGSASSRGTVVSLEGLTSRAVDALPINPFQITTFPFRIGRQSQDPLANNDLMLPDAMPFQISRHHLKLIEQDGRIGVSDRGSRLGSLVDGRQVGGSGGATAPIFFAGAEGVLVLGNPDSPFQYKVTIKSDG
jgi:CRP/FNR family cyclic AMP-dependent transcriptional regulator